MSYEAHDFKSSIYQTQLQEIDSQVETLSNEQYRSANIIEWYETHSDERILNDGTIITYSGRTARWFHIDPYAESGEYYFWIGVDAAHPVYEGCSVFYYSSESEFNSETLISADIDVSTVSGTSKMEGVTINVPDGCKTVAVTSAATIINTYYTDEDGTPQIMISKKFLQYSPYYLDYTPDKLYGNRIYWMGDSIIAGLGADTPISKKIDTMYGTTSVNKAVSDTMIYKGTIAQQVANLPLYAPDVIVTDGGCNDTSGVKLSTGISAWEAAHGEMVEDCPSLTATYDTDTVCGAFEDYLQKIKTAYPVAKVVYVLNHYCSTSARPYADQRDLGDTFIEICKKWGVAVVNIRDDCNINSNLDDTFTIWGNEELGVHDGTHPTDAAHYKYFIPAIANKLREILPD